VLLGEQEPAPLSVPLLFAALAVAVIELFLARIASHATVAGTGAGPSLATAIKGGAA
jgi:hypothetical protein